MRDFYFNPPSEKNADDLYYDAMELVGGSQSDMKKAKKLLIKALELGGNEAQTYIGFTHVYGSLNDKEKAEESIKKAYDATLKKFPKWPGRVEWGDMDNRAYMRAIQYMADLSADKGDKEKAIELYRLLLKLNPNDNQGVRYTLSGVYAGVSNEEINAMFDEGNEKQNWDKPERLVRTQNSKHKFWKKPKRVDRRYRGFIPKNRAIRRSPVTHDTALTAAAGQGFEPR